ncbi:DUF1877 family protein [Streptomyces sp. HUAS ZL42]|uniref:DUF1877 family protein n=1 Tax=Streptomyces sp. HUAS ZL42 TaxID=3231715 RepID=UPI00345EC1CD
MVERFRNLESDSEDSDAYCDLGEEGDVIAELLLRADAGDIAELAVAGGTLLGDDRVGTVCAFLSADEVARVDGFFAGVGVEDIMRSAPEVLSGIIRGGIPDEYLEDLAEYVAELREIYGRAAREGLCMAHIHEG